jgi:endoglucanase
MKKVVSFLLACTLLVCNTPAVGVSASAGAKPKFNDITAAQLVADIRVGWSLGNNLDVFGGNGTERGFSWLGGGLYANTTVLQMETAWSNAPASKANIDAIHKAGFNAVRIPVTWYKACDAQHNIREDWMARVKEVVDYAVDNDMYVILNSHHDEGRFFKLTDRDMKKTEQAYAKIWTQIAEAFKDYDEKLVFEGLNEPRTLGSANEWSGGTEAEHKNLNKLNQLFVDTVRKTGGNNAKRILMIPTYGAYGGEAAQRALVMPKDKAKDKIIVSIHSYAPYDFALKTGAGANTTSWSKNNKNDTDPIHAPLDLAYELFVSQGIPVIMGEMGAVNRSNIRARAEWAEYYVAYAKTKGIPCFWWDSGTTNPTGAPLYYETFGILDRETSEFVHPQIVDALMRGSK